MPAANRTNVPATLSSFIGRASELRALREAVGTHRLMTIVGPGGAGKTRLVREVAAALAGSSAAEADYPGGVWWVELASVRLGADVAAAVASVLAVTPSAGRQLLDALAEALHAQRLMLVLDNCEHLLAESALLADALLRAAPGVTILCTSREALSVEGEVAWPISALPRPSAREREKKPVAADLVAFESVQLFVERARAVTPTFALTDANAPAVAEICERLDGLPLALELAAAVVPVLGVEALAARLDDALTLLSRGKRTAIPRHRTLHAVLDWSHSLLDEDARTLLRNLSVFRGSFTLEAMEEVCRSPGSRASLIPALGRLVEHSLLEVREEDGEARYRLLETVRQFGRARLRESTDEEGLRERHARWVAHVAERAESDLFSPARGRTVERLRQSIDEIRAALTWATGPSGSPLLAARITGPLGWFWISGVPWEEARSIATTTLAAVDAQGVPEGERTLDELIAIGRLFYPIEGLAYFGGDTETMLRMGTREMALWDAVQAIGNLTAAQRLTVARGRSLGLQLMGLAHAMRGEAAAAISSMNASVSAASRSGDAWLLAVMTMRRALAHFVVGDHQKAQADYMASVPRLRELGEHWFLSLALEGMAMNSLAVGDVTSAARDARESVTVLRAEPDAWFISRSLDTMAFVLLSGLNAATARSHDALAAAARLSGAAESLRRRCGAGVIGLDVERQAGIVRTLRGGLGEAEYARQVAAGAALSLADVLALMDEDPVVSAFTTVPTAPERVAQQRTKRLTLNVLGPFSFAIAREGADAEVDAVPVGKVRELLLFLLLHERVTKEEIGLALWPDSSSAQVRNAFHVTLHHLRRQLGPERWIVFDRNSYRLDRAPSPDVALDADVDAVLAASAALRKALRRREAVEPSTLDDARVALERGLGDLAAGFGGSFGEWLAASQDRVHAAWTEGMDALAQLLKAAGRFEEAVDMLEMLVAREPLRESAHRLLMQVLALRGEPARALAHYEALVTLLQREVGSRPAPETRALAESLRR